MKESIYGYIVKDDNGDILLFKNKPTMPIIMFGVATVTTE